MASVVTPKTNHGCRVRPSLRMDFAVLESATSEAPLPSVAKRKRDNYLTSRFFSSMRIPFGMLRYTNRTGRSQSRCTQSFGLT